jgi:uncharacterized membrane protein YsdA (DUF1294 family)/cold shock CspA family protein
MNKDMMRKSSAWEKKETMRSKGKISSWDDVKGFGFIAPCKSGKQVFFHISAFKNGKQRPKINQAVSYTLSNDKEGRSRAVKVRLGGNHLPQIKDHDSQSVLFAAFFLLGVYAAVLLAKIPFFILAGYMALSLITFIMYAVDKSAAKNGTWRTRESTLHLLSAAGGWPGALAAQQKLRHKSKKKSFRTIFWITVIVNCGAFVWLLTSTNTTALRSLIAMVM